MGTIVVIEGVMASDLRETWRRLVRAKGNEVLTKTIPKHKMEVGLGTNVEELEALFEPESGAYGGGHGGKIHQYGK